MKNFVKTPLPPKKTPNHHTSSYLGTWMTITLTLWTIYSQTLSLFFNTIYLISDLKYHYKYILNSWICFQNFCSRAEYIDYFLSTHSVILWLTMVTFYTFWYLPKLVIHYWLFSENFLVVFCIDKSSGWI